MTDSEKKELAIVIGRFCGYELSGGYLYHHGRGWTCSFEHVLTEKFWFDRVVPILKEKSGAFRRYWLNKLPCGEVAERINATGMQRCVALRDTIRHFEPDVPATIRLTVNDGTVELELGPLADALKHHLK